MSNEEILKLAEQAGFKTNHRMIWVTDWEITPYLQRFANLVAESEREAIIDIVAMHGGSVEIESAIRARGEK